MTRNPQPALERPSAFSSAPRTTIETLSRAATYLRPHKLGVAANILCAVLSLASALAFPRLTQYIIDSALTQQSRTNLLIGVSALLAVFLLRDLFSGLRTLVSNGLEHRLIYEMRSTVYQHLQRLPISYFDRMSSGDIMTRVIDDVTDVGRLLVEGIEEGAISIATILFVVIILFATDAYLAMFSLIPLPFVVLGSAWFTVVAHGRVRARRRSLSALSALLLDNLQGIRQIKAFGHINYDADRFNAQAEEFRRNTMRVLGLWAIYVPTMAFLTSLGTVLVWGLGGLAVLNSQITLGELISFIFYLSMLYTPVINIHGLNSLLQSARAAGERLYDILDEVDEEAEWSGTGEFAEPVLGDIRYEGVSFGYEPGKLVLKNICLHVKKSQTIALIGPTGVGKSTLVSLLLGFYKPSCGRILIDEQDIRKISLQCLRRQVSVVSQEPYLFSGTVRENILYGRLNASEDELLTASQAAHCHDFVVAMPDGYDTLVGEHGARLSSGEKQRLSIARAILKNTPILILDEATASIDTSTEHLVQEALGLLCAQRTTIIIAHRLTAIRHVDHIAVLHDGEIVEYGDHGALMKQNGKYATIYFDQKTST